MPPLPAAGPRTLLLRTIKGITNNDGTLSNYRPQQSRQDDELIEMSDYISKDRSEHHLGVTQVAIFL